MKLKGSKENQEAKGSKEDQEAKWTKGRPIKEAKGIKGRPGLSEWRSGKVDIRN
jgi:hypothetical protein